MAFKTFVAGAVLTAAEVNDYLMKQVVIVCTSGTRPGSPVDGMTIYETDTNLIRTYNGSAWRLMAGDTPAARAERSSTQSINSASATAISFNVESYDSQGCYSAGSPTRMTAPFAGIYNVQASAEFAQNATGNRQLHIYVNGATHVRQTIPSIGSGLATRVSIGANVSLAAADYVEVFAFQDSGAALNLTNGDDQPCLTFVWLREAP